MCKYLKSIFHPVRHFCTIKKKSFFSATDGSGNLFEGFFSNIFTLCKRRIWERSQLGCYECWRRRHVYLWLVSTTFLMGSPSKSLFLSFSPNPSTINPILYNVMSHRYRIAFRETLCSRKRGFYSSANGFVRDQSSFRETTIAAASRDHNLNYEGSQLVNIGRAKAQRNPLWAHNLFPL